MFKKTIFSVLLALSCPLPQAELVEKTLAQVGDDMISLIELKAFKKQIQQGLIWTSLINLSIFNSKKLLSDRKQLLEFMICRRMLFKLAEKEKISLKRVEKIFNQAKGKSSHSLFAKRLKKAGLDVKLLKQEIIKDLKINALITKTIASRVTVSKRDVESWYFNKFGKPLFKSFEYEFSFVKFSEKDKNRVLKKMSREGEKDLKKWSQDLNLEFKSSRLKEEDIEQQFKKELKKLSVSQISPLLLIGDSYYVLQLNWKYPLISPKEQKQKAQIEQKLYQQKLEEETIKWIEEKKAEILQNKT